MKHIVSLTHASELAQNTISIQWLLTNICNYSCSYCPDMFNDGSKKGPDLETFKKTILQFRNQFPDKKILMELTGGEVTALKDFEAILEFLGEQKIQVAILSNGARPIKFWQDHAHLLSRVILSYHTEQANPDHFYEVVKTLANKVHVSINVLIKPDNFLETYQYAQKLAYLNPNLTVQLQRIGIYENNDWTESTLEYSNKQKLILADQNFDRKQDAQVELAPITNDRTHMVKTFSDGSTEKFESYFNESPAFKGWECYAGLENFVIHFDGKIYRGVCKAGGEIGNIFENKITFPKNPITCPYAECRCGFDILCTKIKSR